MKYLCIFFQKGKSKPQTVDIFSMKTDFFFYFPTLLSFQKTNKQTKSPKNSHFYNQQQHFLVVSLTKKRSKLLGSAGF